MSSSKFQKGKSGNPKGRPKGSQNWGTLIIECLKEQVEVKENGETKKMSMAELIMKGLIRKCLNGDLSATALLLSHDPHIDIQQLPVFRLRMGKDLSGDSQKTAK